MTPFETAVTSELTVLLRAGVPARTVRLTIREMVIARFDRGPLDAREVGDTVEATVRAACRLARELNAPDEVVEIVCRAALEAVRGHGGESARWLAEATSAAYAVLEELDRERAEQSTWRWPAERLDRWQAHELVAAVEGASNRLINVEDLTEIEGLLGRTSGA